MSSEQQTKKGGAKCSEKTFRPSHLENGVSSIVVCVGAFDSFAFDLESVKVLCDIYGKIPDGTVQIVSTLSFDLNSLDKFSRGMSDRAGVIVAGHDKFSGRDVSMLMYGGTESFFDEVRNLLGEICEKCKEGTIDIVIFGEHISFDAIKMMEKISATEFGFVPSVIMLPNSSGGAGTDELYYDNQNRRLYLVREPVVADFFPGSFLSDGADEEHMKWAGKKVPI